MARKSKEANEQVDMIENNQYLSATEEESQTEQGVHLRSRCGGALRLARENQGLSIQEIASRLRLSPKQIEAIEADNFAILPEATIVRGFIRNYAKQLKINTEPLLDAYNVLVPSNAPHELTVKPTSNMRVTGYQKPHTGRYIGAGLILLLAFGTWLFYQNYVEKPSPTTPSANVSSVEPLPEPALPAAERANDQQVSTELNLPPASTTSSQTAPAGVSNQTPAVVNSVDNAAPPTSQAPNSQLVATTVPSAVPIEPVVALVAAALNGMAKLEFSANQETWVNVVDATGKSVYNKTIFAGSRESIDVTLPVNVTVGNAGATSLSMNGKPIDLAPHSRNNVAHIKLEK